VKQRYFEDHHQTLWHGFEERLTLLEGGKSNRKTALPSAEFPKAYRQICQQLAIARERQYSLNLIDRLNQLALRAYQQLHKTQPNHFMDMMDFILYEFPRRVRQEAALLWVCSGFFYLPLVSMAWVVYGTPEMIYTLLDHTTVAEYEAMYRPAGQANFRNADSDVLMLGYYIYNNMSIGFRTFAMGIVFGVGAAITLLFNGLLIGAVAGYLTSQGYAETFFPFVVGHGAFELTAIVIAGVAGLKLGLALIAPGRYSRLHALRRAAADSVRLIYGVAGLLLLAAFIEAFWSSNHSFSPSLRYSIGGACWVLVILYLGLAGRHAT
jgi:uncharacterized membrane protein SpoIIM required for sporulation